MDGTDDAEDTQDLPTWADLFERAGTYEVDESAVRESLARRRERVDD